MQAKPIRVANQSIRANAAWRIARLLRLGTSRWIAGPTALCLGLFFVSCSSMEEGVVVAKSKKPRKIESYASPDPSYWVEIKGQDGQKRTVTRRIPLFDWEWAQLKKGDRLAVRDYSPFRVRWAGTAPVVKPAPAARRGRRAKRVAAAAPSPNPRITSVTSPAPVATAATAVPAPKPVAPSDAKFREIEARALEDPSVRAAKARIHTAKTEVEQAQASQGFQSAKFKKMRELDASLAPLIDRAESATVKEKKAIAPNADPASAR